MPIRYGPKARTQQTKKKGWPSKTRSTPWRKGTTRPMTLKGISSGVAKSPTTHRFTRWTPQIDVTSYDSGGGVVGFKIVSDDSGPTGPINIGNQQTDGGGALNYQIGGAAQFQLSDLPSVGDFTALFDHYAVEQVDFEINCLQNAAGATSNATSMPTITYVPDFDDATVPTGASVISAYQRAKTWTFKGSGNPLKFSIKPRVAIPVYNGMTSAYAAGPDGANLNLAYTGVPHYGLKFWLRNLTVGQGGGTGGAMLGQAHLTFKMKYHLKFLDPK